MFRLRLPCNLGKEVSSNESIKKKKDKTKSRRDLQDYNSR